MNIAELFVRRRILAYMLNAAIILFGVIGMRGIGIDRVPNVEPPAVVITTLNPGASPDIMDSSITSVIESAVNTVPGMEIISSTSWPGVSQVFAQFVVTKDTDIAFNEVQSKLSQIMNELPREAERPVIMKLDPNAVPVVWLFLRGDRQFSELNRLAEERVSKQLENINGVGEVNIGGGRERKIRVDLDLSRLSALGLSPQDVITAFSREHIQVPGGYLVGGKQEKLLHLDLEFHNIRQLEALVVISRDQVPVRLRDVATVRDDLDDKRSLARYNGIEGIAISVRKVRGANTVAIVEEIQRRLDETIRPSLPDGVEILVATNEAEIISETVDALENHLLEGTLLAGLVVLIFLLNIRATLIIGTAVPVSLAGAVIVMYFGGYTLNIMTLSGLLLLIGVVVDDAIVVLENIHRQHEQGNIDRETAAIQGTREVIFAVLAASLTLVCIFGTVIFMEGMIGIFMRSFAVVVAVGVIASLFVSLTLTPALCARYLQSDGKNHPAWIRAIEKAHTSLENFYRSILSYTLKRRAVTLIATALLVTSTGWFMSQLGSEFFPEGDEARFMVRLDVPLGSSIEYMTDKIEEAEALLQDMPEVTHIFSTVGSGDSGEVNSATLAVMLAPQRARKASQHKIMLQARNRLAAVAGIDYYVNNFPLMGGMGSDDFEVYITGPDLEDVAEYSRRILEMVRSHPGLAHMRMELDLDLPRLSFEVDRDRAQALGISTSQIGDTVRVLAGGADIARYNSIPGDGERLDVRLAARGEGMRSARDLENVYLKGPAGELVRLGAVVDIRETRGPASIERLNQNYSAGFFTTPSIPLDEAMRLFRQSADEVLPPGFGVVFVGQAEEMEKSVNALLFVFVTGMILVYMVLASQFNSFLQPALVMLAQPLAIVGGVMALWLAGHTLSVFSMIGLVLLVGLVSKNSILLVDLINQYRAAGMDTHKAIFDACPRRMRPVLMTSLTIVLAMLPAALGVGAGAGQYGPLAVAVIGGVVSSTLLTLVVVPVAYSLLENRLS